MDPKVVESAKQLFFRGLEAFEQGRYLAAEKSFASSLEYLPDRPSTLVNIAATYLKLERLGDAQRCAQRAFDLDHSNVDALIYLGLVAQKAQPDTDLAFAYLEQAKQLDPRRAEILLHLGDTFKQHGRPDDALACYDQAIALSENLPEAHNHRGLILKSKTDFAGAIACYSRAIALKQDFAEAYNNRGNAYSEIGQIDKALADYDQAIALAKSGLAKSGYNGTAAEPSDTTLPLDQNLAEFQFNKSFVLLLNGNYEEGFPLYEARWKIKNGACVPYSFAAPLWLGDQPLAGRSILLHAEQGLGDSIQICRYIPLVAQLGAHVFLEVPKELICLMAGLKGVTQCFAKGEALPPVDFHCPLMSLPLAFRTNLASIPAEIPYLSTDARKLTYWSQRLGEKTRLRVGVVCSGSTQFRNDNFRSMPLAQIMGYLPNGHDYVCLQKEIRDSDKASLPDFPHLRQFADEIADFQDTAALCELMDVIVTVDTSVGHLAAALGRPTWIALPLAGDWRWLRDRNDSPWYPNVRLFRQSAALDWSSPFTDIAAALGALV
jgi:tetratricopeptide (TPR) repeat protein